MKIRFVFIVAITQIMSCTNFNVADKGLNPIRLQFSESARIQFQGKGAGAGIALMATMGSVGIALGVAIDAGIAKDIRNAIGQEQGDIQTYLKAEIISQIEKKAHSMAETSEGFAYSSITIKRYGFKIMNGSTDATAAQWVLVVKDAQGLSKTIHYPDDFSKQDIKTAGLSQLKQDGKLGVSLLLESLSKVITRL